MQDNRLWQKADEKRVRKKFLCRLDRGGDTGARLFHSHIVYGSISIATTNFGYHKQRVRSYER